jgi:hypothetical protein
MAFSEREIHAALRKKENQSSIRRGEAPVSDEEKVVLHCPHCNAVVDDAAFCQNCSRPLTEMPALEQVPTKEAKGEEADPIAFSTKNSRVGSEGQNQNSSTYRGVMVTVISIFFLLIGYVAGREHIRYEFQKSYLSSTKASPAIIEEKAEKKGFEIEVIDAVKGVVKGKFWGALSGKYLLPAISFSLKNHGSDLNGFFVYFKFDDLDNNRQLVITHEYIDPLPSGWTSPRKTPYLHYQWIDNKLRPDFRVGLKAYIETRVGPKFLYETIYDPRELDTLPGEDENGVVHYGDKLDQPTAKPLEKGTLSYSNAGDVPPESSVERKVHEGNLILYLRQMSLDYQDLPNVQWEKKYSGEMLEGSGVINDLEFDKTKSSSEVTIRFSEQSSEVPGGLSKPFNVDCSFDRCIFRYLISMSVKGDEMALNHKKGDTISFKAKVKSMESNFWTGPGEYWMRDYSIDCDYVE